VSGKKFKRTGIVAAKMQDRIIEPLQYDGTMESLLFETWFKTRLLPSLPHCTTLVMDNASFHRKNELIPLAEAAGHSIIFLPPYSPELNAIEKHWSWLKRRLQKILPLFLSSFLWIPLSKTVFMCDNYSIRFVLSTWYKERISRLVPLSTLS